MSMTFSCFWKKKKNDYSAKDKKLEHKCLVNLANGQMRACPVTCYKK